jgi:hypothetical protein
MYIAKLRDGSNESRNLSKQFKEWVKMEREGKWTHPKRFEVRIFFSSLKIFIISS